MASPVKIQNFRYGVHLKFLRAFYTRPGINRVNLITKIKFHFSLVDRYELISGVVSMV